MGLYICVAIVLMHHYICLFTSFESNDFIISSYTLLHTSITHFYYCYYPLSHSLTHTHTFTHTHIHTHTGASKVIYLILVAMVSSEACSRGSANECEAPRNNLDIKEKCIVVMMVTGTMFEMGEVCVVGIISVLILQLILWN